MVNDLGQLYTIEGLMAGIIMLATAFFVMNTGVVFTPGDAHITDMQLEQLGTDALSMMETPDALGESEDLEMYVTNTSGTGHTEFAAAFAQYLAMSTGAAPSVDDIQFNARVYYFRQNSVAGIRYYEFAQSDRGYFITREPAVRITRFVQVNERPRTNLAPGIRPDDRVQEVLLEVLLWRG